MDDDDDDDDDHGLSANWDWTRSVNPCSPDKVQVSLWVQTCILSPSQIYQLYHYHHAELGLPGLNTVH